MYDFYASLEKLTDNTGKKPLYRYHGWLQMCREWRHLMMLERGGRGHASDGVAGTKSGELAVLCPCCPRPGRNLIEGWEDMSNEDKLKCRLVSSEMKDPTLGGGWSYMLESAPYHSFLLTMSTCSGLAALDYANTKFSRGYSATGVGMGVCARHEFIQPNGVGERYANMDYIFASLLRHIDPRLLKIISYDIMHIHAHTLACQLVFSLNLVPGSAQTDGEGIERPWAFIGGVATKDMLACHWGHWNWQKLLTLGTFQGS
ncbi:hypothetical protein DFH09DRAFT_1247094 [Mycena vulgaris]|nr:hypothetical protein DFH09DRAFT_1247094 [Mycena vulgaris]